ncbi:MAG TPA: anti-sigma factor [Gaiellaceae bacterium]|nr:anti-sigma factor [Gaiellaceae bacterium]
MTEPLDVRELVGDVPTEELAELREVDALLRAVPGPPPPLPPTLARPPARAVRRSRSWTFARLAIAASLVLALAAVSLAAVQWRAGRDDFDVRATVPLQTTASARGANAVIRLGERDAAGTWELELTVSGLAQLPPGSFYVLWLAKDGKYAATCGSFRVSSGTTTHRWKAAYRLDDYDEWVISARPPGLPRDPRLRPWLLHAEI